MFEISENVDNDFFVLKKIVYKQTFTFRGLVFFSNWLDGFEITCTSIRKNALKTLIVFKNLIFCIFEPKNCEVIVNFFKEPLNFSPLKCTYFGKNSFQ